jgi:hypothetical protein
VIGDAARLRQVLLNLAGNAIKFTATGGVALIVEPGIWPNEISFLVRDTGTHRARGAGAIFREFEQADDRIARSYGGTDQPEHLRSHRQAHGRPHHAGEQAGHRLDLRSVDPAAAADGDRHRSRRRIYPASRSCWCRRRASKPRSLRGACSAGAADRMVSDADVALALLPERSWHKILIDHALGLANIERLSEAARLHATQRIVMFTPATRHELQPSVTSAFTGYLVKPLRSASLAARLTAAPEVAAPGLEPAIDPIERSPRRRAGACRSWLPRTIRSMHC